MLNRRHLLGALTMTLALGSVAAAADKKPFDQSAFDAAQAAGKPILVEISASWCPICKAQAPILARLRSDPRFKELVSFDIDFDSQKDLLRKFNVQKQSTLIVFKGKQETGRSTGDTNAESIEALLGKSSHRMSSIGLALLAGLLTALSPCVLPLIPIVIGTALGEHRFGALALAAGLALSFVVIGLFVATVGFAAGLDQELFRSVAAVLLIAVGGLLLLPRLQLKLATAAGPVGNWAQAHACGFSTRGLGGQFAVGLMLGAVWSPCVGPTLGAASVLAARAEDLPGVALTMLAFGIGAVLPLLAIGMMSREALTRWRGRLLAAGSGGKVLIGIVLVAVGTLILTGLDKRIEAVLVEASPPWLTELTTRF